MRISDWSSDVCSSDLFTARAVDGGGAHGAAHGIFLGYIALDGRKAGSQQLSGVIALYGIDVGLHLGVGFGVVFAESIVARRIQSVGVVQCGEQALGSFALRLQGAVGDRKGTRLNSSH